MSEKKKKIERVVIDTLHEILIAESEGEIKCGDNLNIGDRLNCKLSEEAEEIEQTSAIYKKGSLFPSSGYYRFRGKSLETTVKGRNMKRALQLLSILTDRKVRESEIKVYLWDNGHPVILTYDRYIVAIAPHYTD